MVGKSKREKKMVIAIMGWMYNFPSNDGTILYRNR
jgi:hypothetical protein